MDDSHYTYPEPTLGAGFSAEEHRRWSRNLKKLQERVRKKFGTATTKKRGRPKKNG